VKTKRSDANMVVVAFGRRYSPVQIDGRRHRLPCESVRNRWRIRADRHVNCVGCSTGFQLQLTQFWLRSVLSVSNICRAPTLPSPPRRGEGKRAIGENGLLAGARNGNETRRGRWEKDVNPNVRIAYVFNSPYAAQS
jgi:hypothetical protein